MSELAGAWNGLKSAVDVATVYDAPPFAIGGDEKDVDPLYVDVEGAKEVAEKGSEGVEKEVDVLVVLPAVGLVNSGELYEPFIVLDAGTAKGLEVRFGVVEANPCVESKPGHCELPVEKAESLLPKSKASNEDGACVAPTDMEGVRPVAGRAEDDLEPTMLGDDGCTPRKSSKSLPPLAGGGGEVFDAVFEEGLLDLGDWLEAFPLSETERELFDRFLAFSVGEAPFPFDEESLRCEGELPSDEGEPF